MHLLYWFMFRLILTIFNDYTIVGTSIVTISTSNDEMLIYRNTPMINCNGIVVTNKAYTH